VREGDRVLVNFSAANRDESVFDDPDTVVLDRFPNKHAGFGIGIHRCLGSNLARVVFQTVLHEVLVRMPDYRVDYSKAQQYETMSVVNGWVTIPATFTPGVKKGSGITISA
jgi:cytochrome P450